MQIAVKSGPSGQGMLPERCMPGRGWQQAMVDSEEQDAKQQLHRLRGSMLDNVAPGRLLARTEPRDYFSHSAGEQLATAMTVQTA